MNGKIKYSSENYQKERNKKGWYMTSLLNGNYCYSGCHVSFKALSP
jgi:hypothetical protein